MKKISTLFFALLMALSCPLGAASLVSVSDNSVAEWDALPQAYVFEAACPENASHKALKSVKVYADAQYINVLVEADRSYFDADEWVPLHMYIDTDNSDATGGYSDEFTDANADIILETAVFYEGQAYNYNPAVFKWWGEIGGSGWQWTDPEAEHGADDYWGAIVGESMLPVGASQMVDGRIEIQIDRFFIPAEWNNTGFGIGFDILHNWSAVGILPQGPAVSSANNPVPENLGRVAKMKVLIDGAAANIQVIEGIRFLLDEDAKTAQIIGFVDAGRSITLPGQVTFGETVYTVTSIREGAFAGCGDLKTIVCATNGPLAVEGARFYGLEQVVVYVPDEEMETYLADPLWGALSLRPLSKKDTDSSVVVINASSTTVNIVWPAVEGAETYEMIIRDKSGNIVCKLIFNSIGQLVSMVFEAPAYRHAPQQKQDGTFAFTVTNLQTDTNYDLTINAKDGDGNTLSSQTMSFSTGAQGFDNIRYENRPYKFMREGCIFIMNGEKTVTIQGQTIR